MSRKTRKLKSKLLMPFEWAGIALALCIIPRLSRCALYGLCDGLSRVMYVFDRRGKRRALRNLRIVRRHEPLVCIEQIYGEVMFDPDRAPYDPTAAEERIIRRSYRNMARAVGYAFWTIRRARERCAETGEMDARGKAFLAANRAAVTVSGHIGCWEILSQLVFLADHEVLSVAKDIGSDGMTRLLMRVRKSIGQEIVPAEGAFKPLMMGIRAGKSLGLLVDQSVSPKRGGVWVRFLGRPIPVSAAPAFFAAKGKVPIAVAWSRPLKDGRYRCETVDVITSEEARDIRSCTQRIATDLERIVCRHPSCWILNYNYFSTMPTPKDLATLINRVAVLSA